MKIWDLGFAQQPVVWACRSWLTGEDAWRRATFELNAALGSRSGGMIGQALSSFLAILDGAASRDILIGKIGCRRVCDDELLILRVLALCQVGPAGTARSALTRCLPPTAARVAADYGPTVATTLAACGYPLGRGPVCGAAASDRRYVRPATQVLH